MYQKQLNQAGELTSIRRLADGACIPLAPGNRDYADYLTWVEDGNTPADDPAYTLAGVKAAKNEHGCTVNDVILAGVGSAVGRLLEHRGELRPELVLKVFCPVSVRDDDQRMQLGNRISAMLVPLAVGEPDPRVRLDAVRATTAELKERRQAVGADAVPRRPWASPSRATSKTSCPSPRRCCGIRRQATG